MEIQNGKVSDVLVFDVDGVITTEDADQLRAEVKKAVDAGDCNILLNLERITRVEEAAYGVFTWCYKHALEKGGACKFLNLPKALEHKLATYHLLTIFDTFTNEAEAVASFQTHELQKAVRS